MTVKNKPLRCYIADVFTNRKNARLPYKCICRAFPLQNQSLPNCECHFRNMSLPTERF